MNGVQTQEKTIQEIRVAIRAGASVSVSEIQALFAAIEDEKRVKAGGQRHQLERSLNIMEPTAVMECGCWVHKDGKDWKLYPDQGNKVSTESKSGGLHECFPISSCKTEVGCSDIPGVVSAFRPCELRSSNGQVPGTPLSSGTECGSDGDLHDELLT